MKKKLNKESPKISEALIERCTPVKESVEEAIEDIALTRAIHKGLESDPATRDEIFHILESAQ